MADLTLAYNTCIEICNKPNVGYSQDYREGQTVGGITYYDCSSLMSYCCTVGGFLKSNPWFTTRSMDGYLIGAGFQKGTANQPWKKGDILWRSGHTEMVYNPADGGGYTMGAHTDSYPLERQVSINTFVSPYSSWTYLYRYPVEVQSGISQYVIAAICGNFWQESTVNPGLWQGTIVGSPGYGLGQWTDNSATDRRTRLFQWLDSNGYSREDGNAQLEYLIYENVWYSVGAAGAYENLQSFLHSDSTDLDALTAAYMKGWEGISDDGTLAFRQEKAHECFNYISEHAKDSAITGWIVGNRYLSDSERLNNAVMVYRYLAKGEQPEPPEPPHPTKPKRHKMPIWLYPNLNRRF